MSKDTPMENAQIKKIKSHGKYSRKYSRLSRRISSRECVYRLALNSHKFSSPYDARRLYFAMELLEVHRGTHRALVLQLVTRCMSQVRRKERPWIRGRRPG